MRVLSLEKKKASNVASGIGSLHRFSAITSTLYELRLPMEPPFTNLPKVNRTTGCSLSGQIMVVGASLAWVASANSSNNGNRRFIQACPPSGSIVQLARRCDRRQPLGSVTKRTIFALDSRQFWGRGQLVCNVIRTKPYNHVDSTRNPQPYDCEKTPCRR